MATTYEMVDAQGDEEMSDKDGGPAFPQSVACESSGARVCSFDFVDGEGMSLRDYFAGQALAGVLVSLRNGEVNFRRGGPYDYELLASGCYALAEAMLTERTRENKK